MKLLPLIFAGICLVAWMTLTTEAVENIQCMYTDETPAFLLDIE